MREIKIRRLAFGSYLKLFLFSGMSFGLVFGVLMFLLSLAGGNTSFHAGNTVFRGFIAGVFGLLSFPMWGLSFAWFALFMFLPFKWFLHVFKSITFTALIEEPEGADQPQNAEAPEENQPPPGPDDQR